MHCLDCHTQGVANTAVALCLDCGAAVCEDHARITTGVRRGPLLGPPYGPPTRSVRCRVCGQD
ncbi:DUF2180 family protein [Streptomyces sp. NPDC014735]|uniref:DUF2180 family protein n=1 Tax=unclassified Streptomyces TaxID=2593676 RepID=UPI0036F86AFF